MTNTIALERSAREERRRQTEWWGGGALLAVAVNAALSCKGDL